MHHVGNSSLPYHMPIWKDLYELQKTCGVNSLSVFPRRPRRNEGRFKKSGYNDLVKGINLVVTFCAYSFDNAYNISEGN